MKKFFKSLKKCEKIFFIFQKDFSGTCQWKLPNVSTHYFLESKFQGFQSNFKQKNSSDLPQLPSRRKISGDVPEKFVGHGKSHWHVTPALVTVKTLISRCGINIKGISSFKKFLTFPGIKIIILLLRSDKHNIHHMEKKNSKNLFPRIFFRKEISSRRKSPVIKILICFGFVSLILNFINRY